MLKKIKSTAEDQESEVHKSVSWWSVKKRSDSSTKSKIFNSFHGDVCPSLPLTSGQLGPDEEPLLGPTGNRKLGLVERLGPDGTVLAL